VIAILVDADACPVKDEVYVVATRFGVPVAVVANSPVRVPEGMGVQAIRVPEGPDAADDWIAEEVRPGDIVVTADLPLAARCLGRGARVLGFDGRVFERDTIGELLATRDLKASLREAGISTSGPPPLSDRDRSRFLARLDELVRQSLRGG